MSSRSANTYFKILLGVLFLAIILAYTYIESGDFSRGPEFTYVKPDSGTIFEGSLIEIEGNVKRVSEIELNSNPIFIDEEGNFNEQLLLSPGINIITLYAKDRFGRETEEILELIYK